jgi:two-component system phosphate regulon response regulator PhoB
MSGENIFIVEDDKDVLELIKLNLQNEGYCVNGMLSGEELLEVIKSYIPDVILLDLMLPGINGLLVCETLRKNQSTMNTSIIMLTSKGAEEDVVAGLELGADDYIIKPFSTTILIARIKAVLRRKPKRSLDKSSSIKIGSVIIDPNRYEVFIDSKPVSLTTTEVKVLHFLASSPGWVFTRSQIMDAVKGDDNISTDRSIDVLIAGLRKKLSNESSLIKTIRGIGYSFGE